MADIIERDEQGRVITSYLSTDEARKMRAMRRTAEDKNRESSELILEEMGYSEANPAPETVVTLAKIAAEKKTGAVSAIGQLLRIAHGSDLSGPANLAVGDKCPTCGQIYGGIGASLAREVYEMLIAREAKPRKIQAAHGKGIDILTA